MSNFREHMFETGAWPEVGALDREPPIRAVSDRPGRLAKPAATLLRQTVALEVIPRLLAAHRALPVLPLLPVPSDVLELCDLVLALPGDPAARFVESVRARGMTVETVFTDLLAPVARRLGTLWEQDLCDIAQVTVGVGRLNHLMRELSPRFHDEQTSPISDRAIMLMPAPGEDHTFGLSMVAEYFRRDGWLVRRVQPRTPDEMSRLARQHWCAVVGVSVGSEAKLRTLRDGITQVRRSSRNRDVVVMVGGPMFIDHPELAREIGADATAADGGQAVRNARALVGLAAVAALGR